MPITPPSTSRAARLRLWAVLVSFIGIRGHANWPSSDGAARGIMGISALLVVAACATAVVTA